MSMAVCRNRCCRSDGGYFFLNDHHGRGKFPATMDISVTDREHSPMDDVVSY
jgi:hypothetical protein